MNLVIDIGNTVVKAGIFEKRNLVLSGEFATQPRKELDEWGILLSSWIGESGRAIKISNAMICSVVTSVVSPLKKAIEKYFRVLAFEVEVEKVGISLLCDNPGEVGADRIANVVAAAKLYKLPAIVIDFGTAATFDVISEKGEYLGGVIAPGVRTAMESLAEKTEALFSVDFKKPASVIGKNTKDGLEAGLFYGCLGGVKEIIRGIKKELGKEVKVIATGGMGILLAEECAEIDEVDSVLTLKGLNFIAEKCSDCSPG
jgi:type III pantothenate kinase